MPAAGPLLAIDNANIGAGKVFNAADALWISPRRDDSLLPYRERNHRHGAIWKQAADLRQIRFSTGFVAQMRSGNMDASFF